MSDQGSEHILRRKGVRNAERLSRHCRVFEAVQECVGAQGAEHCINGGGV